MDVRAKQAVIFVVWALLISAALVVGAIALKDQHSQRVAVGLLPATCIVGGWAGYRVAAIFAAEGRRQRTRDSLTLAVVAMASVFVARSIPGGLIGLVVLAALGSAIGGLMLRLRGLRR